MVKIVVLRNGIRLVGKFRELNETEHELTDACVVQELFGAGVGALRRGPAGAANVDPCGRVTFHPDAVLFKIDCEDGIW